jgi:hypothetical protein
VTKTFFGKEFHLSKFDSFDGKTKIAWTMAGDGDFSVIVDSEGLEIKGKSPKLITQRDLQDFAELIGTSWQNHLKLAPKLSSNLMDQ